MKLLPALIRNREGIRALEHLEKEIEESKDWLLDEGKKREPNQLLFQSLQDVNEVLQGYSWYGEFSQSFRQDAAKVQKLYEQLLATLDMMKKKIEGHLAELQQERKNIETELNALAEESGQSDFKTALSRRKELTDQLSKILSIEQEIQDNQTQINQLFEARREQIVPALTDVRQRIYQARLEKAKTIADKLAELKADRGVSIEIEFMGDSGAFSWELGHREGSSKTVGLFKNIDRHYLSKDYPGFYARKFSPHKFVEIFLGNIAANRSSLTIDFIRERGKEKGEIVRVVEGKVVEEGEELTEHDTTGEIFGRWAVREFEHIVMEDTEKIWEHLSPWYHDGEIKAYYDP